MWEAATDSQMTDEKRKEKKNFADHWANTIVNRLLFLLFLFLEDNFFHIRVCIQEGKKTKTEAHAVSYIYIYIYLTATYGQSHQ